MDGRACVRCGADLAPGARFCTGCGLRAAEEVPSPAPHATGVAAGGGVAARPPAAQLVECEACGAGNAASRPLCARCGAPLREEVPGGDALPEVLAPTADGGDQPPGRYREGPSLLLALVVLAGLFSAGVLLALVTARVAADDVAPPEGIPARSAAASGSQQDRPPSAAIDSDPTTAWVLDPPAGGGEGWLEVLLERESAVTGLLVWNGDQADERRFGDGGRASLVRIEVGDRSFRVALRDLTGPQAVDLPEAVTADRVRIVIEEAVPGRRGAPPAISEVLVEGA